MDFSRPDPDELLKAVQHHRAERGNLKIFLGASAGVGKTYAMLSEAHEQKKRGVDIVIGYAEGHRRAETIALFDGLEELPRTKINYRDSVLEEVNVPAVIARHPDVVLIDELAHTNTPGSTHAKRWQDINDILDAGISVFTAVNIQHLESLNDVVAKISGVTVHETVPDSFFDQAKEIELIDLPPGDLQQRLREGKIYVAEQVSGALDGFFKASNLTALRELALRRTADSVEAEMQRLRVSEGVRGTWATRERVVVCIAPNQMGARVIRSAARLGAASHAELIAVYVQSDRQASRGSEEHLHAEEALELASALGFEIVHLQGHDIVAEILDFAKRRNATLIVVGKPIRARWREIIFGSVVDMLVRSSGDIDVHVLTGDTDGTKRPRRPTSIDQSITAEGGIIMASCLGIATAVSFAIFGVVGLANVAMIFVLGVALSAIRCNRLEISLLSIISVLIFNFFFVEPRFTFAVSDARYLVLFAVMLTIGIVISTITHRLREQLRNSSDRERRTASLYALSKHLVQARGKRQIARVAAHEISSVFGGEVAVYLKEQEKLLLLEPSESKFESDANEFAVASWVSDHQEEAGFGTHTLPGSCAYYLPIKGLEKCVGVLAFKPRLDFASHAQRQFMETFANGLGVALERTMLVKESNDARVVAQSERIRSTLLSSISHDLRTPLTSISGAASSLKQGIGNTKELSETIFAESVRLNQQIQNLLDMTRLQTGHVQLNLQWQSPQELIASAIEMTKFVLEKRMLVVEVPAQTNLFLGDGLLLEKALTNLLENAARFTKPGDSITVKVSDANQRVVFQILDTGTGISPDALENLFTPGFHVNSDGFGLGLAIVEAITRLHGGRCWATNNPGSGATFFIEFPLPNHQPEVPRG